MLGKRIEYQVPILFNGIKFSRVIIDQHYKKRHSDYMSDEIILSLVKMVQNQRWSPDSKQDEFDFFRIQPVHLNGNPYRLILVTRRSDDFLGVINAFRVEAK